MNKKTFSIEFSFDIDAGTIELLGDDKWCVNIERITIDDDNKELAERSLDASEFANCSGRSVIEVDAIIDNAVNKMKYCFASLEVDVLTALKERFEKETQVKSFDNPAIEMWVSDRGDVYLREKYIQGRVDYWRRCYNTPLLR